MTRFLADANIGTPVVNALRSDGHDVAYVRELNQTADDEWVQALANDQQRIVLTNDLDFGHMIFRDRLPCYGVMLLRLGNRSARQRVPFVRAAIEQHERELNGNIVVVGDREIRIRPIPSGRRG